ncbi:glycosyltransferase family 2 protein [Faecalibacterium sp. OF04-11AC]|uniref:glycosyltransferase family 2 protein n=1 Tax=Faecalibacterium sp. OF04-11AC TaxID=2293109 RepID=UPI000E8D326B|nr:glycosyltransferase family 2 protein [Faecalibacterium sp. OF04-11AC]RGF73191.1 glycosyltransferase family 2 protein [Faecalibacterium sp. OF04-11AC]
MQLDKETKLKQEKERCRQLAQRVAEEARPASAQVLNSESDLLEKALRRAGIRAEEWSAQAAEPVDLLVVEDPVWSHLPQQLPEKVLLASVDSTMMAAWAEQLARRGYYRDFRWRSKGRAQQSALFCTGSAVPAPLMMVQGYEQEMDTLRDRMVRAERTCSEEAALIERLRSDLALSRSHEQQLEKTLSDVTNSTFWKLTWPMRYAVSKSRQIWHTFPLFVFLHDLRAMGVEGVREQARARREYAVLFPSKTLRADRFAPVELLVKQASHQPGGEAGPKISIVVPLYNTPLNFLEELLDSVVNQTYRNWELCCVDAGQDTAVGQHVQARAKAEPRIRYQKLTENEGIAGNTNHGFELATGDYIALLDHDDILHPCALWYTAQAIVEQGADFVYTDEATFEGKVENVVLYHFKPDFMLDNLRSNNYICHLTTFSKVLMEQAGGGERAEYNGSQDYDLFLRLTEKAQKIAHIPHALYYWRSSPNSTASDISAKTYCIDAGIAALKAHYARCGVAVDDVTLIPGTPGYYKTDYTMAHPGRVSILIPTCDHIRDLETCVESIYARTTYPDFEILLIENNSKEEQTFRSYERMRKEHPDTLKVVTWTGKGFNYSALNNFGARYATGEYLLLLNNDTEVITPGWLEEMVMYAQQKRVGCVGAKLLYPDDTIQHAGVGFGIGGVAGHLHKYFPATSDGYMGRLNYVQDVYGDTAACLLIRKEIYDEVHGLDESYAVAFNDVDFCVRVREAGYTNVFTPFAQLYHYESKSRGMEDNPEKQKRFQGEVLRFQARWGDLLAKGDPCTNPNFDIQREDFSLKILPLE